MDTSEMEVDAANENVNVGLPRPAVDFDAIIAELRKPAKNPAPRGKRIIDPIQARYLHRKGNISVSSIESTLSESRLEQTTTPIQPTPTRSARNAANVDLRAQYLQRLHERQQQYHEQEMALGGYHNVFKDPCPDFKPRKFAQNESTSTSGDESQDENLNEVPSDDALNRTITEEDSGREVLSQGRVGQGCSTPQNMVNHTFAQLRQIDVSSVMPSDSTVTTGKSIQQSKTPLGVRQVEFTQVRVAEKATASRKTEGSKKDDSMEDVFAKMRATPKRGHSSTKKSTAGNMTTRRTIVDMDIDEQPENEALATFTIGAADKEGNATYSIHRESTYVIGSHESREGDEAAAAPQNLSSAVNKDSNGEGQGTFTIVREDTSQEVNGQNQLNNGMAQKDPSHHGTSSRDQDQNGTFTIQRKDTSQQKEKEEATASHKDAVSVNNQPVFAIPTVPARATTTRTKTTVEQRESRMNTSQKKNASILEMMDVDVASPGRTLFAARPPKKKRTLVKTPVRSKPTKDEDAMEVSIAMSDISQQPSSESRDGSGVDPMSDPRPSQTTPTRAPGFARRPRNTPDVSLNLPAPPATPASTMSNTPVSIADLSPKSKKEAIRKSVERLSRPKHMDATGCRREMEREARKVQVSPYSGNKSNVGLPQPVTPFQPQDISRMIVMNADRSGTARRVPLPRTRGALSRTSLFPDEVGTPAPAPVRRNLLKRPLYKSTRETALPETSAPVQPAEGRPPVAQPEEPVTERSAVNASMGDVAPERRIPENVPEERPSMRAAVSLNDVVADGYEESLLDAARQLSLEDISPSVLNKAAKQNGHVPVGSSADQQKIPQKLLTDSMCSTNTPHRVPPEPFKRPFDNTSSTFEGADSILGASLDDDTAVTTDEGSFIRSVGQRKKVEVMILKPRKVLHPSPPPDPTIRRSSRNRMKPVRQWLGEKPVYEVSPRGSKTLVGVNEVEVRDKRWLKVRTANLALATEREHQLAAHQRKLREKRKQEALERKKLRVRELRERHRRGVDLNVTEDSIVTSSDEDDNMN